MKPKNEINTKPLRDSILNREELLQHAIELAQMHQQLAPQKGAPIVMHRVQENARYLRKAQANISEYVARTKDMLPAAEWFLDNYYLVNGLDQEIRHELPKRYLRQLVYQPSVRFPGYPRVYALAAELVEHCDSQLRSEVLIDFINAYQSVLPLSSGELWAIPVMLKIALQENIKQLATEVVNSQNEHILAEKWLEPFNNQGEDVNRTDILDGSTLPSTSPAFIEYLLKRMRYRGLDVGPVSTWLERELARENLTCEMVSKLEHRLQAACQVSMGHAISALRFLREENWALFFEQTSPVESILTQDPAEEYLRMDFDSRDFYRHRVEKIARSFRVAEAAVAKRILFLAGQAEEHSLARHVGYYLTGRGSDQLMSDLEQEWGSWRNRYAGISRLVNRNRQIIYFASIALLTLIWFGIFLFLEAGSIRQYTALELLGIVLTILPAASLAVTLVNWIVTKCTKPAFLPKLSFEHGLPQELRSIVVIPTLFGSTERVSELLRQLEVYYLANQDEYLHFALLGDYMDALNEHMPEDEEIIKFAVNGIERLNTIYGEDRFFLLHRRRLWNPHEGVWMGWERKRGKLLEFNRFLSGEHVDYAVVAGNVSVLKEIKYVITLDADTQLPRDTARKLIGAMAHPLHRPVLNEESTRVVSGYALMQPRVGVSLPEAQATRFSLIFAGQAGIDPYTTAVSDVYQDLFGEGCFTGKGIYEVKSFHQVTQNAFPENIILSHDLIEGIYARTGLLTDVQLIDGYPAKYLAFAKRAHRWTRGDWQIAGWLFKPLPALAKWKIFDNLRRSLEAPAQILLVVLAFLLQRPSVWLGLVGLNLLLPLVLSLFSGKLKESRHLGKILAQAGLLLVFLPFQAYMQLDAVGRSLVRRCITHRRLLEWQSAADTESRLGANLGTVWRAMWPPLTLIVMYAAVILYFTPSRGLIFLPLALVWLCSPWVAHRISLPLKISRIELAESDRVEASLWARRIWAFFEDFVTDEDHWLPPDNVQIQPDTGIAHRTSPTNIGLALLANLAARDMGYLGLAGLLGRVENTLLTLEKLERWQGHFYNWYDTLSLKPLPPLYVSTVDSGNLLGYLITLRAGLKESEQAPIFLPSQLSALRQTFLLIKEELDLSNKASGEIDETLQRLGNEDISVAEWQELLRYCLSKLPEFSGEAAYWVRQVRAMAGDFLAESEQFPQFVQSGYTLTDAGNLSLQEIAARNEEDFAKDKASAQILLKRLESLQQQLTEMIDDTDLRPLYDKRLQLFSIGYRVTEQALDKSFYDLLASEARQASYLAIAKGDVPQSHWFRLGRALSVVNESRSLLAWSGTMFEFLMPLLIMRSYPGTLLDETYHAVVGIQRSYGAERHYPWGISESGFYAFDAQRNYQYKAFGVPGLGLKRGLAKEMVVAPYASFLALMVQPGAALHNLRVMHKHGFNGRYGFYEAIDFTKERVPVGKRYGLVQSFMAHHQGMSFIALVNSLYDNSLQSRFHSDPMIQAAELLLQERLPEETAMLLKVPERLAKSSDVPTKISDDGMFTTWQTPLSKVPLTHFLSNGRYALMLTNVGSGFSRWDDLAVSRWREDVTQDDWGMYFYVQNLNSGEVWSATSQPCGVLGEEYQVTYAPDRVEYCRRDGNIATRLEVVVSPEDMVELRRLSLTNHSGHDRTVEVTSYFEVVLAGQNDDMAHQAFGNLFIETEYTNRTLLAHRRKRRHNQKNLWLMHTVAVEGEETAPLQHETDRGRFIGRNRSICNPCALDPNQPLSQTTGAVLDPIMSLRPRLRLKPGQTARICFATGVGESRAEVIRLAEKYKELSAVERAFELAWTFSQMELEHLNLLPAQANAAMNLGSNLLYLNPVRREYAEVIAQNHKGQSSLWAYGISGDLPIAMVVIEENEQLDMVRQLLVIHNYWRLKGLSVDLVILNQEEGGYRQTLQNALRDLVASNQSIEWLNKRGGVFILQENQIPAEDLTLLRTTARLIFSGNAGSLMRQLRQKNKFNSLLPQTGKYQWPKNGEERPNDPEQSLNTQSLLFYNGYGGFSADGREYVTEISNGSHTPLPWLNVLANQHFGLQISESGASYTWAQNSREYKLTPWTNDPVLDRPGEVLYLRDEETGEIWTPTPAPLWSSSKYVVRHGQGYSVFEHNSHGIAHHLLTFVPIDKPVKLVKLTLRNLHQVERTLSASYYMEPVLGVAREQTAPYLVSELADDGDALLFRNTFQEDFAGRVVVLSGFGGDLLSWTGDRTEFIGRNGTLQNPNGLTQLKLSGTLGAGLDPCGVWQIAFSLKPGEEKSVYFLLGEVESKEEASKMVAQYRRQGLVDEEFRLVQKFWQQLLTGIQVHTPDNSLDILVNRWLLYQTVVCRILARSAFYQSGGAYGFRDQLQDVMPLALTAPYWTREQIIKHCAHQFLEGDVQHWWHEEKNKGIRTKFSDDLLWLPFVTADYIEHTADYGVLDENSTFLEDEPLGENEDERYSVPRVSGESASVYEHCVRAIDHSLHFGEHGLPLIGSGDWNDGFSRIGVKGRGESVWLGWFLYLTLARFIPFCVRRIDTERAEHYRAAAQTLQENLDRHGWDGSWYRRAFFDDGTPLGSARNEECQIDAIAQAWAVLSGAADPKRAAHAMESLERYLWQREEGLLQLLTPPFDKGSLDPGYIKGYVPGVRENGGQYTHGATWVVLALCRMGEGDKATELFHMLNPVNHTRTKHEVAVYKTEPYVMAADVYAVPPHTGRGGWTWYTGSAGWMYQAAMEEILGFNVQGDKLSINPCIPANWPGYSIEYRYRNTEYRIKVKNPGGKMTGVSSVLVDGQSVDGVVSLMDDGKVHQVEITM